MEELNLIVPLEAKLKAMVRLTPAPREEGTWLMALRLYYENDFVGNTSFTLRGHTQEEAEAVARGIPQNDYLMQEIDLFLWTEENE